MKIRSTGYSAPLGGIAQPAKPVAPVEASRPAEASTSGAEGGRRIGDSASIMGIPPEELTPKVQKALQELLDEVSKLRRHLDRAQRRLDHLEQLADQDSLTPVLNRRAFERELARTMSFTERYHTGAAVIYFDVNGMKTINDEHGHAAGDAALHQVARILVEQVRSSDVVGRLGGDEFGVILAQATPEEAALKGRSLAEAIASTPFHWKEEQIPLKVAYGVHSLKPGDDASSALDKADQAMYRDKRGGRGGE